MSENFWVFSVLGWAGSELQGSSEWSSLSLQCPGPPSAGHRVQQTGAPLPSQLSHHCPVVSRPNSNTQLPPVQTISSPSSAGLTDKKWLVLLADVSTTGPRMYETLMAGRLGAH